CTKPVCVALSPHKPFGISGHELAVVIEQLSVTTIDKYGIEQGSSPRALRNALYDADNEYNPNLGGKSRQRESAFAADIHAFSSKSLENSLDGLMIPESCVATNVHPRGISGKPRLGKNDNLGARRDCFAREGCRSVESF